MKKILIVLLTATNILWFTGCDRKPVYHTISGYLYEDCNMEPLQNHYVELIQGLTGGLGPTAGGFLTSGYTDSTGYFELVFEDQNGQAIKLMDESSELMLEIPGRQDSKDLVVYRHPTCNIQVSLNVMNAYTEDDMLVIANYADFEDDTLWGPFTSGILYTAIDYSPLEISFGGTPMHILWYVNNPNDHRQTDFLITDYCNDTTFVTVDIY